jgi:hypothetical protein
MTCRSRQNQLAQQIRVGGCLVPDQLSGPQTEAGDRLGMLVTVQPLEAGRGVAGSCCSWNWRDGKWGAGHQGRQFVHATCRSLDGARVEVLR